MSSFTGGLPCIGYPPAKVFEYTGLVRSSPRSISTAKLNMSPCLHMQPIYQVVFLGPYLIKSVGYLILRLASRLDAFSVYPIRT